MMATGKRIGIVAGVIVCFLALPGAARPASLGKQIRSLVESAIKGKKTFQGKKVGTGTFVYAGKPTRLGAYIAKQVQVALFAMSSAGGFEVLDRSQLCQLAAEHELWTDDRFRDSDAQKIGNLMGVDALAVGDMEVFGDELMITLSIISTVTSTVMAAVTREVLNNKFNSKLLGESMSSFCSKSGGTKDVSNNGPVSDFKIVFEPMKKRYELGDKLEFRFTTTKDAYVTLVDLGTSGDVTIIFPNRFTKNNFVRAGQTITVPSKDADFEFILGGKPGREIVRAIATKKPVTFLPKDFHRMKGPVRSLSRKESSILTRDISAVKANAPASKWAEDRVSFEIR